MNSISALELERKKLIEKKRKLGDYLRSLNEKERKIRARALISFGAICASHLRDDEFEKFLREMNPSDADVVRIERGRKRNSLGKV